VAIIDDMEERVGSARLDQDRDRNSAGSAGVLEELVMLFGIRGLA